MEDVKEIELDPPVRDANGEIVPAFNRYEREKITVVCNQTGSKARLPNLKSAAGITWLSPGESIDLEDIARPAGIENSGLNMLLKPQSNGTVLFTIHPKGSNPVGKAPDVQKGPVGRVNQFDKALDEFRDREERMNERTSRQDTRRTGSGGSITEAHTLRG